MRKTCSSLLALVAGLVAGVGAASAQQSKIVIVSNAADISADGNTAAGYILNADVDGQSYIHTRGVGHTILGPAIRSSSGRFEMSDDARFWSQSLLNGTFGAFNPPFGYYNDVVVCCTGSSCAVTTVAACTGTRLGNLSSCSPNPCPAPASPPALGVCCSPDGFVCTVTTQPACTTPGYYWMGNWTTCGTNICKRGHFVGHRFDTTTGTWTNLGSFPNIGGQGAAKCDGDVNSAYGISGNGQFTCGGGLYGTYGSTSCATRGYVWSQADNVVRILPPTGTGCQVFSQAEFISDDGLIVCGTDTMAEPTDPTGITAPVSGTCNVRTLAVWERAGATSDFLASGRTILDRFGGGGLGNMCMTPDGKVFSDVSGNAALYDLGDGSLAGTLVRYQKVSGSWTRTLLGKVTPPAGLPAVGAMIPRAVSDDGNTVVGTAIFGGRSTFFSPSATFIWKANFNGGVPVILSDYLNTINGGQFPPTGTVGFGGQISADGNALLVSWSLNDTPGCTNGGGLTDLSRSAILYLDGSNIGCEPPRIIGGPYDRAQQEYTQFGIVGNVFFTGSYPIAAQWQKEIPTGSGNWVNISNTCGTFSTSTDNPWIYEGTQGYQLRINMLAPPADRDGNFRVVLTNSCGTAISDVATINAVSGACCYSSAGQVVCSIELSNRCTGSPVISFFRGGTYLGDNTTCSPETCDVAVGACCSGAGGADAACVVTIQPHCTRAVADGGIGGTFVGLGTSCGPAACAPVSGACCYSTSATSNVICTLEVSGYCTSSLATGGLFGAYRGNNTTCSPTSCNTVAGACCASPTVGAAVICTIQTQTRCEGELRQGGLQGLYAGSGQTCDPGLCSVATGACCHSLSSTQDSICTIQIQNNCIARVNGQFFNNKLVMGVGGVYRGDGTTCGPTSCTNFVGACCFTPFGEQCNICTIQPQVRCTDPTNIGGLAGTWGGAASVCSPTTCAGTGPGACCAGTFCLIASCETDCVSNLAGTYQGAGSACGPTTCGGAPDSVCCRGATCSITTQASCTVASGTAGAAFLSGTTTCNAGSASSPCCHADYNKAGGISVQDIFDFLNDWFAGSAYANTGGNGTGAPQVQSIFDFLNAWFAGGC